MNQPPLDHQRNAADIGVCALESDAQQSDQRDQNVSKQDRNSHGTLHHVTVGSDGFWEAPCGTVTRNGIFDTPS